VSNMAANGPGGRWEHARAEGVVSPRSVGRPGPPVSTWRSKGSRASEPSSPALQPAPAGVRCPVR